jgi:hypothetical protein
MIYVPILQPINNFGAISRFSEYAKWCDEVAGFENKDWWWKRGDLYGQGIFFKDEQVAIMFKLKFPV